jgi:IS605 OrfB family transposase
MSDCPLFTYQTRLVLDAAQAAAFDAYAELYGRAERALFAALSAGRGINELKRAFLPRFGITARQFNALRVGLEGKIASIKARRPELITESKSRIEKAESVVAKLAIRAPGTNKLHQKKRRLATLKARCAAIEADQAAGRVRLCFGSKRLFHAQFDLAANGYASPAAWKADWQRTRSGQFFVLGSGDETAGNQSCQASIGADGSLRLRLRLPDALGALGSSKTLDLTAVRLTYGHDQLVAALASSRRIHAQTKDGRPIVKRVGTALSYRFMRDDKGWRLFVSVEAQPVAKDSRRELGAIGVDVNVDHLAVSETDRFGNLIGTRRIDLVVYGKTQHQARALIGDAAVSIAAQAKAAGKPVVIEKLEFQKKKAELEAANPKQARLLSSFACRQVAAHLQATCYRAGVEVIEVNPAYTSVIGAVNHAQRHGISVHMGAALAIARRGLGFSERPPKRLAIVPVRKGGHITFALPARNRAKHVWSYWAGVRRTLKAAHAAHVRSGEANAPPAPLLSATRAACSHRAFGARLPDANRSQHCSESVLDDVPW